MFRGTPCNFPLEFNFNSLTSTLTTPHQKNGSVYTAQLMCLMFTGLFKTKCSLPIPQFSGSHCIRVSNASGFYLRAITSPVNSSQFRTIAHNSGTVARKSAQLHATEFRLETLLSILQP